MSVVLEELRLRLDSDWIAPSLRCYRPPNWPPSDDCVVSEDRDGNVASRWGDPIWDLSPLAGRSMQLNFGDGPDVGRSDSIDPANAKLLRIIMGWRLWGPRAVRSITSLKVIHTNLRGIFVLCSREGILASELMRFPKVLEKVPAMIAPSSYRNAVIELHRYWDARDDLGFILLDQEGIKRLAAAKPDHDTQQTAYIPPRIWTYQVQRLRQCLDDFLAHRQQVEDCFNFCVDSYAHNAGSLQAAMATKLLWGHMPFGDPKSKNKTTRTGRNIQSHGLFRATAERFGIVGLLERWVVTPDLLMELSQLTSYLTIVQNAGLAYITNFTLQRISEATSLRTDCLQWEDDPKLGRVPVICGETTKTDQDSDARWPTSPSVEVAVAAMTSIARLRIRCASAHPEICPSAADQANPYLYEGAFEPWTPGKVAPYTTRVYPRNYRKLIESYPLLFDKEHLRITEEDLRIARTLTPNLSAKKGFVVGEIWPMAWHQLRRTSAVNMFASGLLSDSSMQFQMKHSSRLMPLYYGRGYTKLHLNEEVEGVVITAMYEAMARSILAAMGDRFVSPYPDAKNEIIVNLIGDKDAKELAKAAQRGEVFFRETRLGGCTKRGNCSYGGIESVARCAGGDGYKPCTDVLYDRTKAPAVEKELQQLDQELARVPQGSPRHQALLVERRGLENFLNVVRN